MTFENYSHNHYPALFATLILYIIIIVTKTIERGLNIFCFVIHKSFLIYHTQLGTTAFVLKMPAKKFDIDKELNVD